jgi:ATP-binding cassette, subfamily C, bacterial
LTLLGLVQLTVAFSLAPLITAVVVVCGGLLAALVRHRRGDAYRMGRQFAHAQRAAVEEMSDCLAALKLAKSHNAEDRHRRQFADAVARQQGYFLTFHRRNAEARMLFQLGATLALGAFVYVGAMLAGLATPELLVLIVIFARLMPLLGELQQSVHMVAHMLPVFDDLTALLARCEAARESLAPGGTDRLSLRQEIRFQDVRFRYDAGAEGDLLDGLDLIVPAGAVFAISGASGAGKSTLADMMMGLLVPDSGTVSVDGAPLTGLRLAAWRRSVAYVPQDNFLFNQSLRANLQWAAPDASEAELRGALSLTGADPLLAGMPAGLDTIIGERGNRLSGGERQRIAIARALLRRPTLLVLDEATSALDDESESAMWAIINRLRGTTTIVIIAHRSSALRQADLIAVLEKGRIVRSGPWQAVMEKTRDY